MTGEGQGDGNRPWKAFEAFKADRLWQKERSAKVYRDLLARLHSLILKRPSSILQDFERILESDLENALADAKAHLSTSGPTSLPPRRSRLFEAAVMLRALDALLLEEKEHSRATTPKCWLTSDGRFYVVPLPRAVLNEGGPRLGQFFTRRGLLYHRVIPRSIDDVRIELDLHPDLDIGRGRDSARTFGAALFSDFALEVRHPEDQAFIAVSASCKGGMDIAITKHCAQARKAGCDTVLWPELTMPPDKVAHLQNNLVQAPLETRPSPVIVAGSWHMPCAGGWANTGTVLDGRGEELLTFGKRLKFVLRSKATAAIHWERIKPYPVIHILMTERELIAFAICKDFCGLTDGKPPVVGKLDVDLVLVPSMGGVTTILAQRDQAQHMKIAYGTRTVVVQQLPSQKRDAPPSDEAPPPEEAGVPGTILGYVLKAPDDPGALELKGLATSLDFTTFQRPGPSGTPKRMAGSVKA